MHYTDSTTYHKVQVKVKYSNITIQKTTSTKEKGKLPNI